MKWIAIAMMMLAVGCAADADPATPSAPDGAVVGAADGGPQQPDQEWSPTLSDAAPVVQDDDLVTLAGEICAAESRCEQSDTACLEACSARVAQQLFAVCL